MIVTIRQRIAAIIILGVFFVLLLVLISTGQTATVDQTLRNWVLGFNTATTVVFWKSCSFLGSVTVLSAFTFLTMGIFAVRHDRLAVRHIGLAMAGAVGLDTFIKWAVHRPRPDEVYLHTLPSSYSFPSGHTLYSLVFYTSIAILVGRHSSVTLTKVMWCAAAFLIALIGLSRLFLGVHYASDVLGGYVVGTLWLVLITPPRATLVASPTITRR